jgi:hypothetical protein
MMRGCLSRIAVLGLAALAANADAQVGLMPVPVFKDAAIRAAASFDRETGRYVYAYTAVNPAGNTGELWMFKIDVSADAAANAMVSKTSGLILPLGVKPIPFSDMLARFVRLNAAVSTPTRLRTETIVPFGQEVPPGWHGGLSMDSTAGFARGNEGQSIRPGASLGGFRLLSFGVPTVREVEISPWWVHVVEDQDKVTPEQSQAAGRVEQDTAVRGATLGPSGVAHGSPAHWNQLRDDLAHAAQLGWIADQGLARNLTGQLASARAAFDARDLRAAGSRLQALLAAIAGASPGQATPEGVALVSLNVQSLLDNAK